MAEGMNNRNNVLERQKEIEQQQQKKLSKQYEECQRLAEDKLLQQQKYQSILDSLKICPLHNKKNEFIFIASDPSPSASFIQCQQCVDGSQTKGVSLKVSDILEDGQDTIFPNYPFIHNKALIDQIKGPALLRKSNFTWIQQSKAYIERIGKALSEIIVKIDYSISRNIQIIDQISDDILNDYYQCSAKEQLKEVIVKGLLERKGGIEEEIKTIVNNAIKNTGEKEEILKKKLEDLKQSSSKIDLATIDTMVIMVTNCLSLIKVHKEKEAQKIIIKEDIQLPGEERKSIEVIQMMLQAVTKELKKAKNPSEYFKERVKEEIQLFSSKMNEHLIRKDVVKAEVIEKIQKLIEVNKEQENKLEQLTEQFGASNQNEGKLTIDKTPEYVQQILRNKYLKMEEEVEINDKESLETPQKESLGQELRNNNAIIEIQEDMEFEENQGNEMQEFTEEEMIQQAIEESQNEEMLKMELENKIENNKIEENNQKHGKKQIMKTRLESNIS